MFKYYLPDLGQRRGKYRGGVDGSIIAGDLLDDSDQVEYRGPQAGDYPCMYNISYLLNVTHGVVVGHHFPVLSSLSCSRSLSLSLYPFFPLFWI